ncbi:30S ribosomal protein S4 [Bradymonadaceae bacterium TMQ3]|uniref:Small ribosomal subunit protein uS4 n=1 Tax=Lujinxingia sediminis TaxID=2480984 RepID=A0ABY0CRG8_9DELT|nr:30S ribosomal protein S4 [Lujinxingia sediminis]RDV37943.1 30S ribosomal protein S4 [Bradymonadaceae bacterium TMQ3]RVU42729.1 30S ribosomal protein S4 [Lujinxingia sediminis]TXC75279.1 30S ribosomal protein S4 [Bradymonadales bacterium TMQ1]
MARYTGPRLRIARRLGTDLPGLTRKLADRRPYPPGQHGQGRQRFSEFKKQLYEKQKLRYNYGLSEGQLRNLFVEAQRSKDPAGLVLLRLLEQRLDNVIFRLGLAPTIPAARQLVVHGHVVVDGKKVDRPSYRVEPGREISVRAKSRELNIVQESVAQPTLRMPGYLSFDSKTLTGKMLALPSREDIPVQVQENLVVEYYSPRL